MQKTKKILIGLALLVILCGCKKEIDNQDQINFNPVLTYGTMTDQDGNIYKTIKIGNQVWMAENLRTTKYRNDETIPQVSDSLEWKNLSSGAYCNYRNDNKKGITYGHLYNWYAVNDTRILAPLGWHIPTDTEIDTLAIYLGGYSVAGGKLKESGITHWIAPNDEATNESGFTAMPGGYRSYGDGSFNDIQKTGVWWTSSEGEPGLVRYYSLYKNYNPLTLYQTPKNYAFSVRCVKDK